jgi:hypothetical protein
MRRRNELAQSGDGRRPATIILSERPMPVTLIRRNGYLLF